MKLRLVAFLVGVAVLSAISSCTTDLGGSKGFRGSVQRDESYIRSEVRLLSVDSAQTGELSASMEYWTTVNFEANTKPEISRACFKFSGGSQSCVDVQAKDVTYSSHPYFRVPIHIPVGTKRIECYAEYIQEGEKHRTNTVSYPIVLLKKPEE